MEGGLGGLLEGRAGQETHVTQFWSSSHTVGYIGNCFSSSVCKVRLFQIQQLKKAQWTQTGAEREKQGS